MKFKCVLAFGLLVLSTSAHSIEFPAFKVSVDPAVFKKGDRIRSFDLKYKMAKVGQAKIPEDSSTRIDNWKGSLKGWTGEAAWGASVGAGQLYPEFFNDFMTITISDEKLFDLEMKLVIENITKNSSDIRTITLKRKDFRLTSVPLQP